MNRKLKNIELNRMSVEEFKQDFKTPLVVVLDNVRSLHNVGSVFRTSDAFKVTEVLLCGITGCPPHREIEKTALGATESVDWRHFSKTDGAIVEMKNKGYKLLCIEQAEGSVSLSDFVPLKEEKYLIVFGNEVEGVSQSIVDKSDFVIEIPQIGTKHSMNVSVSCGIVLWDLCRKLGAV